MKAIVRAVERAGLGEWVNPSIGLVLNLTDEQRAQLKKMLDDGMLLFVRTPLPEETE